MRITSVVLVLLLLGGCGGGDTRVCVGSSEFCRDAFGRNRPPDADAGPDQEVVAGDRIVLDGSGSDDPDGRIASYSWTQRSGEPVAIENADQARASFTAPAVDERVVLEFRLVVTDDDDASDDDRVRVTVLPVEVAALRAGVALLKTVHQPAATATDPACARCWSQLGLWLGARVHAAEAGADAGLDELLDALRAVEQVHDGRAPDPPLAAPERRLLWLGQRDVARFTARRDPATADLAAGWDAAVSGRTMPSADDRGAAAQAWREALAARPDLARLTAPDGRRRAASLLLGNPSALDGATVAAATLVLALP